MLLWSYLIYVAVAIGLTFWLASTLFANGSTFLADVFDDRPEMAQAMNRLLVVGFYMLNLGWAFLIIRTERPGDAAEAVEILATKLGLLLFTLGIIHFLNLWVFSRIRRSRQHKDVPPIQHTMNAGPMTGPMATGPTAAGPYTGGLAAQPYNQPNPPPW